MSVNSATHPNKLFLTKFKPNELSTILRDLGNHEKLNVKHLLSDFKENEQQKNEGIGGSNRRNHGKKRSKKQKSSNKMELFRQKNTKRKQEALIKDDLKRLEHYDHLKTINEKIISNIKFLSTEYGRNRMKFKFLQIAYKNDDFSSVIELYLQLIDVEPIDKKESKTIKRVKKMLKKFKYKEYQFESMSNRLPPLDFYNNYVKKLDQWQIDTLRLIEQKKDIIVCARTSMGKTWLAMYPGLSGMRTLFIVPTKPLVYQVASIFTKFLNGKTSMITKDIFSYKKDDIVVVGTPNDIETNLHKIRKEFDVVVCDEIHNLNNYDGDSYERLIKLFSKKSKILALSATIGNSEELGNWFQSLTGRNANVVKYSTRFLNLQRHVWTSGNVMNKLHPFACLTMSQINDEFLDSNLPLTPYDNIQAYKALCDEFGEEKMTHLNIDVVFPDNDKRLTLNDSKVYEDLLKKEILKLKQSHPTKLQNILDKFSRDVEKLEDVNLYSLVMAIKNSKMTPCIMFQLNKGYCKEIFEKIVYYLEKLEVLNYPFHYDSLEWHHKYYEKHMKTAEDFEKNIVLGQNDESITKDQLKEEKMKDFQKRALREYQKAVEAKYDCYINQINKNGETTEKVKKIQIVNLKKDLKIKLEYTEIRNYDIFEKHPDFCMGSYASMTADEIRVIRKKMCRKLGIKIDYNNIFIQGLKRGIGIYTEDMPDVYNQTIQLLAQNAELGFIISDRILGLGINMPIRTCCLLGYKDSVYFSENDYQQFIGRAGRRGLDKEGHVVYCNVDWKSLMKGKLGNIVGQTNIIYNYKVLNKVIRDNNLNVDLVFQNYLNSQIQLDKTKIQTDFYHEVAENLILWNLRDYDHVCRYWLDKHDVLDMKLKKNHFHLRDMLTLLNYLLYVFVDKKPLDNFSDVDNLSDTSSQIAQELRSKRIENDAHVYILIELLHIVKTIHNCYLRSQYYLNLRALLRMAFKFIKKLLNNNQCLNVDQRYDDTLDEDAPLSSSDEDDSDDE